MKYAVIETGGKQYTAREGEMIDIDRMPVEADDEVIFENVLLVSADGKADIGTPYLADTKVIATVIAQVKGPKILAFRYIPKERVRRRRGHRQQYTRVRIDSIQAG